MITPVSLDHAEFLGDTLGADRRREGRHPQARRAGDRRRAAARRARRDRTPGRARQGADPDRRRGLDRDRGARAPRLSGRCRACSTCRRRSSTAGISSRTRASPSRRCARPGSRLAPRGLRERIAKADWPARMQRLAQGRLPELGAARQRAVARRRPQCRRRPRHRQCAGRPRGARAAAARADRRHARDQGLRGVPAEFFRPRAPRRSRCRSRIRRRALPPETIAEAARAVGIPAQAQRRRRRRARRQSRGSGSSRRRAS